MATKGSLIEPAEFFGLDIVPESIASAAAGYKTTSTAVTTNAEAVMTDWSGLSASYTAPEGPQLFASMDPVRTDAETVAGKLSTVADLLETLAESVTAPVARIKELVTEANAFRASVAGGVTLDFYDPDNPLFQAAQLNGGVPIVPEGQGETTIPWNEHTPSVERNNELQSQYNAEIAKIDAARVEFENGVNALRDDLCVAPQTAVTGEQLDLAEDNPWGAQGKGERSCQESVGDGLVEFGTSFVEGTVSLVGFDAANGWKHDWSFAGEAWTGMLTGLGALAITVVFPVAPALANLPDSAVPESLRGLRDNYKQTMDGMVGGIVGTPEQWEEDPVAAGTFAVANVASFFIPGAGQVGAGLKVGSGAARAATLTGRLAEVAEDASHLPKGLSRVEDLVAEFGEHAGGLSKLDDLDGLTDTMAALERMTDVEFSGLTGALKAGETVDFGSLSKLEDFADHGDLGRAAEEARAASATHADPSAHAGGGTGSDPAAGAARAADPGSGGTTLLERGDGGGAYSDAETGASGSQPDDRLEPHDGRGHASNDEGVPPMHEEGLDGANGQLGAKHELVLPQASEVTQIDFTPNVGHDLGEFHRQLDLQQRGLNDLTVGEYLDNRAAYESMSRPHSPAQQAAREDAASDRLTELILEGVDPEQARLDVGTWLKGQNALHSPDMISGGRPDNVTGLGHAGVNKSLGSQWRTRVAALDDYVHSVAGSIPESEWYRTRLNVRLTSTTGG